MKPENSSRFKSILEKSKKIPINRNEGFFTDAVSFIGSIAKTKEYPDFLVSWAKEIYNIIKDENKINLILVLPEDYCWGLYIKDKANYYFSYNEGQNIYISYRLYKNLRENNSYKLLAGLLVHEVTELLMRVRTEKKGLRVDINKNHGEAIRLERAMLGKGKVSETPLLDLFIDLVEMELARSKIVLDKQDIFVEGCAISGEEIITEIRSTKYSNESFIIQMAPGQKKTLPYSGGVFTAQSEDYKDLLGQEEISFKDYCSLLAVMDDYFIEESVIRKEGLIKDLLDYIRGLDFFQDKDNLLLNIIWLFTNKYYKNRQGRLEFLYNLFLVIDEYWAYSIMKEIIINNYWKSGRYVKDNLEEIIGIVHDEKQKISPSEFCAVRKDKEKIGERLLVWFSKMELLPSFSNLNNFSWTSKLPHNITECYKKSQGQCLVCDFKEDILKELSLHEEVLMIKKELNSLMYEARQYSGVKRGDDKRICEFGMVRVHFWKDKNIFARRETVRIFLHGVGYGIGEVLDVKEYSVVIFLKDPEIDIPEKGYIKKLEEEDMSISATLEAIGNIKKTDTIIRKLIIEEQGEEKTTSRAQISFFNSQIAGDKSQSEAVAKSIAGGDKIMLIQGPPGTGKTTVIAEIILQYLKMNKRVLLSSQTNNAVDNALKDIIKWKDISMGIGRVASKEEKIVDACIKDIWIKLSQELEKFENEYEKRYVIGATNVGTHTLSLMKGHEFDVLVMDEAGKANLVESILPMLLVKEEGNFIIVGDHKQGAPFEYEEDVIFLFLKKQAELYSRIKITHELEYSLKARLNMSLFERLIDSRVKSTLLKKNYRSSPHIVELVSRLFYNNELIPAKEMKEKGSSIIIVDTSKMAGVNERKETEVIIEGESRGFKNIYEAKLIVGELRELLKYRYFATGIKQRHITGVTILAPYIFQIDEIRRQLAGGLGRILPNIALEDLLDNVTTIDSFQGRENEIIIISFTRSNDNPGEVGFLNELNRINVALSRAKRKMILVGDFRTLLNVKRGSNAAYIRKIFKIIYETRARK